MTQDGDDDEQDLYRLFSQFDQGGDGQVDIEEFRTILALLGETPSDEVLLLDFSVIDSNGDGKVGFQEFKTWWLDK
jgi:Ca2+-binding EF-hand superfamily protein